MGGLNCYNSGKLGPDTSKIQTNCPISTVILWKLTNVWADQRQKKTVLYLCNLSYEIFIFLLFFLFIQVIHFDDWMIMTELTDSSSIHAVRSTWFFSPFTALTFTTLPTSSPHTPYNAHTPTRGKSIGEGSSPLNTFTTWRV